MKRKYRFLTMSVVLSSLIFFLFVNMRPMPAANVSGENERRRNIAMLYIAFFDRVAEKGGMDYWLSEIRAGETYEGAARRFFDACIQFQVCPGVYRGMPPAEFVKYFYERVASRKLSDGTLTQSEVDYWAQKLYSYPYHQGYPDYGKVVLEFLWNYSNISVDIWCNNVCGYSSLQLDDIRGRTAKFMNKVQVSLIGYRNGFNIAGDGAYITQRGQQVVQFMDGTLQSAINAIQNSTWGLGKSLSSTYKKKILVIGQSNAANFSNYHYDAESFVTFYDTYGKIERFYADSQYAGHSRFYVGDWNHDLKRGSVWGLLGDKLNGTQNTKVFFDTRAVGGSEISRWAPGGDLFPEIESAFRATSDIDTIIFQQGESDNGKSSRSAYASKLQQIVNSVRAAHPNVKFYITTTSYFGTIDPNIVGAQNDVITAPGNAGFVFRGINTDSLGPAYRHDGLHFNKAGIEAQAQAWFNLLK